MCVNIRKLMFCRLVLNKLGTRIVKSTTVAGKLLFNTFAIRCSKNCFFRVIITVFYRYSQGPRQKFVLGRYKILRRYKILYIPI